MAQRNVEVHVVLNHAALVEESRIVVGLVMEFVAVLCMLAEERRWRCRLFA